MQLLRWNNAKPIQEHDTRPASSTTERGLDVAEIPAFRSKEKYSLDIPFYRSRHYAHLPSSESVVRDGWIREVTYKLHGADG
jgi:hypothetical protein